MGFDIYTAECGGAKVKLHRDSEKLFGYGVLNGAVYLLDGTPDNEVASNFVLSGLTFVGHNEWLKLHSEP